MEYNHTEQLDGTLHRRVMELEEINQDWQSPERRHQIKLELACIVFEEMSRYAEAHPEMAEAIA